MSSKWLTSPFTKSIAFVLLMIVASAWILFGLRQGAGDLVGLDNAFVFESFPKTFAEKETKAFIVVSLAILSMLALIPSAAINSVEKDVSFRTSWSYMGAGITVMFAPLAGVIFGIYVCVQLLDGKLPMSGGSSLQRSYASHPVGSVRHGLMLVYVAIVLSWQPTLLVWMRDVF
jgi:hypothetical protein